MNMAEEASEPADTGAWDNSILIKAYDTSVKLAREELAKHIAIATNKKKRSTDETMKSDHDGKLEKEVPSIFKVGDYARGTYEDGVDYEAKIIDIYQKNGTCLLKYIGYENQQEVRLCDLVPSWGKRSRRMQFSKAKQEAQTAEDTSTKNGSEKSTGFMHTHFNLVPQPPPMPPMPPMAGGNYNEENSGHLSAMLMSWYLSGYYTGIYQGTELAKSKRK